ncbi:hypothetical protein [Nocardiopsis sp. MG754419]|uniref:hypothetical protein n=1 Tax=Nocardiopsis sp. MG754419 TaxID=2259865 RepID=UPI0020117888|nr:hypothetical protein [Nocardiopsis sp. MG754419]
MRHAQIEGRTPIRALVGYLALCTAARRGTPNGRPIPSPVPTRLTGVITIRPTTPDDAHTAETGPEGDVGDTTPAWAPSPRATTLRDLLTAPTPPPDEER